jgi:hypothetical protein
MGGSIDGFSEKRMKNVAELAESFAGMKAVRPESLCDFRYMSKT